MENQQTTKFFFSYELFERILRENGSYILKNLSYHVIDEGISLWDLVPITVTYGLTFIIGVIGNLLVLLTILIGISLIVYNFCSFHFESKQPLQGISSPIFGKINFETYLIVPKLTQIFAEGYVLIGMRNV